MSYRPERIGTAFLRGIAARTPTFRPRATRTGDEGRQLAVSLPPVPVPAGARAAVPATLKAAVLTGTLKRSDRLPSSRPGARERIQLKIQAQAAMRPAHSYAEWKRQADELLKRRGPKW